MNILLVTLGVVVLLAPAVPAAAQAPPPPPTPPSAATCEDQPRTYRVLAETVGNARTRHEYEAAQAVGNLVKIIEQLRADLAAKNLPAGPKETK